MIKRVAISVAAALFVAQGSPAEIIQNYTKQHITQTKAHSKSYVELSNKVCHTLELALFQICNITSLSEDEKNQLEKFLKITQKASQTAQKRYKQDRLECDLEVLYYTLAASHILESVLDDEFMRITGGYKMPEDILAFGKSLRDLS